MLKFSLVINRICVFIFFINTLFFSNLVIADEPVTNKVLPFDYSYNNRNAVIHFFDEIYKHFGIEINSMPSSMFGNIKLENLNKYVDQIAKIHIIASLIGDVGFNEYSSFFIDKNRIVIESYRKLNYTKIDESADSNFYDLLGMKYSGSAIVFNYPYNYYTVNHKDDLIIWLDEMWDENKIFEIIKSSGISEPDKLINILNERYKNIKKILMNVEPFVLYNKEKIDQKRDSRTSFKRKFNLKNDQCEFKPEGSLPRIEQQILFCFDEFNAHLELTNYEFLINGKETNQLVTVFIGNRETSAGTKIAIELFDPEAAFVFQDAVLKYYDKNKVENYSLQYLAQAVQAGYTALNYHFGFINSLNVPKIIQEISSPDELLQFINNLHNQYKIQAVNIGRYVTTQDIIEKKSLGFSSYYPNPIYLNDLVWYIRPEKMSYTEYHRLNHPRLGNVNIANPETLYNKNMVDEHNEYYDILKVIYPENNIKNCPAKCEKYCKYSDVKSLSYKSFNILNSAYVFRGDDRSLEQISYAKGFDSELLRSNRDLYVKYNIEKYKSKNGQVDTHALTNSLKSVNELWKFKENTAGAFHTDGPYISTSKNIDIANVYGKNVYVLATNKGIEMPIVLEKKNNANGYRLEVIVPLHVDFSDIIGTRHGDNIVADRLDFHVLSGHVFLKNGFEQQDQENFWEILQLFGGMPQVDKMKQEQEDKMFSLCDSYINNLYDAINSNNNCEQILMLVGADITSAKAACMLSKNYFVRPHCSFLYSDNHLKFEKTR